MSSEELWTAECSECCSGRSSYKEYRAEMWADDHTDDTGHKVIVNMEPAE